MRTRIAIAALALLAACQRAPAQGELPQDFRLASATVDLPEDADAPPLPAVLTANCTACHSAGMLATQPALKPEQWAATVKKMREVYKGPIADNDVPAILAELTRTGPRAAPSATR